MRRAGKPDAFLLSPAFPSQSPSAQGKKPLYRRGLAQAAGQTKTPLYALGGVNGGTIKKIENMRGIMGGALVSGLF
jgi:thiamine monophosphate synthase